MFQIKEGPAQMGKGSGSIAPMAYCIFLYRGRILLIKDEELSNGKPCYRPIGGKLAFGEYSWEAIRREVKSLIGEDVKNLEFVAGPSEVVTELNDNIRHEIIFLFKGELDSKGTEKVSDALINQNLYPIWRSLKELKKEKVHLYPEDLMDIVSSPNF
ncbi:MAG: NUDIX domain-containing protein [Bacteroidia bacterium]|nr:NUDIX domain-containing protein [Bacteroidia bacterium]